WIQELEFNVGQSILRAYDATNLANELYSSAGVNFGAPVKFSVPTICNGKVFVGTTNSVAVFGTSGPVIGQPTNYISYSGDFNADHKQDILWRNLATGNASLWMMSGTNVIGAGSIGNMDLSWKIVGIGDFNRGGKRDIVWYNPTLGKVAIWPMN